MGTNGYLSPTQLNTFLQCGHKWRYRYIQKLRLPASDRVVFGRIYDAALQRFYASMIAGEPDTERSADVMFEMARLSLEQMENTEGIRWEETNKDEMLREVMDAIMLWREQIGQTIKPLEAAKEIEWLLPVKNPIVKIHGVIDLITQDNVIVDDKAASRKASPESSLQMAAYTDWFLQHTGRLPEAVVFHTLVRRKSGPTIEITSYKPDETYCSRFRERALQVCKMLEAQIYILPELSSWVCSEKYCDYYNICEHSKGGQHAEI